MSSMSTESLYNRIVRREIHSPRSAIGIIVAVVILLASLYLILEFALELFHLKPLLVAPSTLLHYLSAPSESLALFVPSAVIGAGAVAAVLGVILMIVGIAPGRRARHTMTSDRGAVVIDDAVIASSLAKRAATVSGISPDQVVVTVGKSTAHIVLTPTTGTSINEDAVAANAAEHLEMLAVNPSIRATVSVRRSGVIGA
jgi:hypothetical protein